jgi:hypothetical protein
MAEVLLNSPERQKTLESLQKVILPLQKDEELNVWIAKLQRQLKNHAVAAETIRDDVRDTGTGFAISNAIIEKHIIKGVASDSVFAIIRQHIMRDDDKTISLLALLKESQSQPIILHNHNTNFVNYPRQLKQEDLLTFSNRMIECSVLANINNEPLVISSIVSKMSDFYKNKYENSEVAVAVKTLKDWLEMCAIWNSKFMPPTVQENTDGEANAIGRSQSHSEARPPWKDPQSHSEARPPWKDPQSHSEARPPWRVPQNQPEVRPPWRNRGGYGNQRPFQNGRNQRPQQNGYYNQRNRYGFNNQRPPYQRAYSANVEETEQDYENYNDYQDYEETYSIENFGMNNNINYDNNFNSNNNNSNCGYNKNDYVYDRSLLRMMSTRKLSIDLFIGRRKAKGLVDCGATICLIRPEFASNATRKKIIRIKYANGASEELSLQTKVRLVIDGVIYQHWCWVAKAVPYDMILGTDFLADRAVIDFVEKIITFKPSENDRAECMYSVETVATSKQVYQAYAVEQRDKAIEHVNRVVSQPEVLHVLVNAINRQWEINRDDWLPCDFPAFEIEVFDDSKAPYSPPYRGSQVETKFLQNKVDQWLFKSIARFSLSPYGAPTLLVPKKDYDGRPVEDLLRAAVNYRRLNGITVPSKFPLPYLEDIMDKARGDLFSVIDGEDAYHQVLIKEEHVHRSAFNTSDGHYEFLRMQYGMLNAGNHLQCHTELMLLEEPQLLHKCCEVFVDDNIVFTKGSNPKQSLSNHVNTLKLVLDRYSKHNYKVNFVKSSWALPEVTFGGRIVSKEGIRLEKSKVEALVKLPAPSSFATLHSIIGLCLWHKPWIPRFADIMEPIMAVARLDNKSIKWSHELWNAQANDAFIKVKSIIVKDTLRSRSGPGVYHIWCDFSPVAVAYHMTREHDGNSYLMAYGSHTLRDNERHYSAPKGEFFGMWKALERFWWYILGRNVQIHLDCQAWPISKLELKNPHGVENRWLLDLSVINPEAVWIRGVKNKVSDCMTRVIPIPDECMSMIEVPEEWRNELLEQYHNKGHFQAESMYREIKEKYSWPRMFTDIVEHVKGCNHCQIFKDTGPHDRRAPLKAIPIPERAWQTVGIDVVGPISLKNGEKKFFFIAQCYLTKEVVTKNLNASTITQECIRTFEQEICWRHDNPELIISDRGTQLVGVEFMNYVKLKGITLSPTARYHHQGNGQVESAVKIIKPVLLAKIIDDKMLYKDALRAATSILNKQLVHTSTKMSSHKAVYGNEYNTDFDNRIRNHLQAKEVLMQQLKSNLANNKMKIKSRYDIRKNSLANELCVGCFVLVRNHAKKSWDQPEWIGPYEIVKVLQNDNYLHFNLETGKTAIDNQANLKLFVNESDMRSVLPPVAIPKEKNITSLINASRKSAVPSNAFVPSNEVRPTGRSYGLRPRLQPNNDNPVLIQPNNNQANPIQLNNNQANPIQLNNNDNNQELLDVNNNQVPIQQHQQNNNGFGPEVFQDNLANINLENPVRVEPGRVVQIGDRIKVKWIDDRWPDKEFLEGTVTKEAVNLERQSGSHLVVFDMDRDKGINDEIIIPLTSRDDGGSLDEFEWLENEINNNS